MDLKGFERLCERFYATDCQKEEKRYIEEKFYEFKQQRNSWKMAAAILQESNSNVSHFFALSVFQHWLRHSYHSESLNDKLWVREFLFDVEIVVDVARYEWPDVDQQFVDRVLSMTQNKELKYSGLLVLKTFIESILSLKEDLPNARKSELKNHLLKEVQRILELSRIYLDEYFVEINQINRPTMVQPVATSPGLNPFETTKQTPSTPQNTLKVENEILLCFEIFSLVFQWNEASCYLSASMYFTIFKYSYLFSEYATTNIATHALTTANDILSRSFLPHDLNTFLIIAHDNLVEIVKKVMSRSDIDETFEEKLLESIRLLILNHFKRIEGHVSLHELFSILLNITKKQTSLEMFEGCLEIWQAFSSQIEKFQNENVSWAKYDIVLIEVFKQIWNKSKMMNNSEMLCLLDDSNKDVENKTEWDHFQDKILALIHSLVSAIGMKAIEIIIQDFLNYSECFLSKQGDDRIQFCVLKDLRTTISAFNRISDLFSISTSSKINQEQRRQIVEFIISRLNVYIDYISDNLFVKGIEYEKLFLGVLNTSRTFVYLASENSILFNPIFVETSSKIILSNCSDDLKSAAGQLAFSIISSFKETNFFNSFSLILENPVNSLLALNPKPRPMNLNNLIHMSFQNNKDATFGIEFTKNLILFIKGESSNYKKLAFDILNPIISQLDLLNQNEPIDQDLLLLKIELYLEFIQTFGSLLGVSSVQRILELVLLRIHLTDSHFVHSLAREDSSQSKILCLLFAMFISVTKEPSKSFDALVPLFHSYTLNNIYPLLNNNLSVFKSEIYFPLVDILFHCLVEKKHHTLRDDILETLFHLALTNQSDFATHIYQIGLTKGTAIQMHEDFNSFSRTIINIVNDFIFYNKTQ
ncbi:hypothetical protein ROZALSC1DRAFT_30067 [Rozella allomycis CSF55]|uniref:Exportin-1/Importin-beta-like domain-containing protein n=1 Tax=Rozella allomycis (strain CSF55) TaxID=988480 RepID=A0A4V1IZI9_ROZAC|nr:hypothetical protein ROZALSC1DRAFT_30067 [Rozella allomycis CSF55]